jgi:hypothetical protein
MRELHRDEALRCYDTQKKNIKHECGTELLTIY